MKRLLVLTAAAFAALLCGHNAHAQLAYGYPHSIDMQVGSTASLVKVDGLAQRSVGVSDGASFGIRYTGYMTRHFGLYAGLSFAGNDLNDERYFAIVNRADGNAYRYGSNHHYTPYNTNYAPIFTAGVASRFDFGQVSIRPRIGVGRTGFKMQNISYKMADNTGYEYDVRVTQRQRDYLLDQNSQRLSSFMMEGSLQMTYTFFEHFYVSAEAGLQVIPEMMTIDVENGYTGKLTTHNMSIPDIANLKFGIGWNIGWNRNHRARPVYYRRY